VWLLSRSTNLVVKLVGGDPRANRTVMTEQELRDLVASNQVLSQDEREIVSEVFDAGKRQLREVLLPRTEVEFVSADTPLSQAAKLAVSVPYSRLPVYRDSYDNVIGFVHIRDLLDPARADRPLTVGQVSRHVKFLPISKTVLAALSEMRRERAHLAIVIDEYGGTAGIVTLEDLVEELIGDIRDEYDVEEGEPRRLRGGEVEVEGLLNLHEFAEQTGIDLPEGPYETAAGFVLARLGEVPAVGQSVEVADHRITVTEMDGRRIARLRIAPAGGGPDQLDGQPQAAASAPAPAPAPAPAQAPAPAPAPAAAQPPQDGRAQLGVQLPPDGQAQPNGPGQPGGQGQPNGQIPAGRNGQTQLTGPPGEAPWPGEAP